MEGTRAHLRSPPGSAARRPRRPRRDVAADLAAFAPGLFPIGIGFGLVAGFFEEIGWTGYAYPRLSRRYGRARAAVLLGLLWGCWHVPVVDSLGAASPHGPAWLAFFAGFVLVVAAVRVLICWAYSKTGSVLLAQAIHASSTGSLAMLSPPHVTAAQEAAWYAAYGTLLWLGLAGAAAASGPRRASIAHRHDPTA